MSSSRAGSAPVASAEVRVAQPASVIAVRPRKTFLSFASARDAGLVSVRLRHRLRVRIRFRVRERVRVRFRVSARNGNRDRNRNRRNRFRVR